MMSPYMMRIAHCETVLSLQAGREHFLTGGWRMTFAVSIAYSGAVRSHVKTPVQFGLKSQRS
jgi:hypothetical protein